ncbi:putative dEAD/DEAH box helicase-like protein [Burkholderia sp. MSHR3999]|uniref:hypothetical protein n=1 Tax=Burkholderia sp. MSHR3999 TaxID=1542965 RepID=UPI0005B748B0|nr:hypothetical protein [Burkholderia sp. MSHR3999]KIP17122.1 putative dEAD/DEAH box helicase-like protein [Burkholderia sp. MSHR3999]
MICNIEHVRQSGCEIGNAVSADEAMNEGKPSHVGWENFTREEPLAELVCLHAENVRLTALLPTTVPTPDKSAPAVRHEPSPVRRNSSAPCTFARPKSATLPAAVSRPHGRLSASLGKPQFREVGLRAGLRQ